MPPPRRRVKNARAIPRADGRFAPNAVVIESSPELEDITDDTVLTYFDETWAKNTRIGPMVPFDASPKRPVVYTGDADRTKRRKKAEIAQALRACPMAPIATYFGSTATATMSRLDAATCVTRLQELFHKSKAMQGPQFVQICVLLKFFELRVEEKSRFLASNEASACLPAGVRKSHSTVRSWARTFEATGALPTSSRGCHQKSASMIQDEDFLAQCTDWLRLQPANARSPQAFRRHLESEVLPKLTGAIQVTVSESTALRWMRIVGYTYGVWKKGVYMDGHERPDVQAYRTKFCSVFLEYVSITVYRSTNLLD